MSINQPSYRSLEEQFKNPHKIELYERAEILSLRDIQPKKLKTETPVLLLRAWGTTSENYKDNMIGLAEKGRRILAVDNIYGISARHITNTKEARELISDALLLDKIAAILKVFEVKEDLGQIDVIAHSEGAIHAVFAALLRPEKFRNLLLINPAGMVGEDNRNRVIKQGAFEIARQVARLYSREGIVSAAKKTARDAISFGKVVFAGPQKTWDSIGTISKTQIHELIGTLRNQGIRVSIIHGVDDGLYSVNNVQQMTKSGTVHEFHSTETGHNEIYLNPEPFNILMDSSLDVLENIRV